MTAVLTGTENQTKTRPDKNIKNTEGEPTYEEKNYGICGTVYGDDDGDNDDGSGMADWRWSEPEPLVA